MILRVLFYAMNMFQYAKLYKNIQYDCLDELRRY